MATLTISHYIYLSKDQRYNLHAGQDIEAIGVSIPVWFHKGSTSEPAKEIFCKYKLTNENVNKVIVQMNEGYVINLPQKVEKEAVTEETPIFTASSDKLLDVEDNGAEYMEFRQYNKVKQGNNEFNVVHFVEIKTLETLSNTLS